MVVRDSGRWSSVNPVHPKKAPSPMVVRDSGRWTWVNPVHPLKGIISDGRKGLWEMDLGQSGAFPKGTLSDGRKGLWEMDFGQSGAPS
jgi:hypothetical protein